LKRQKTKETEKKEESARKDEKTGNNNHSREASFSPDTKKNNKMFHSGQCVEKYRKVLCEERQRKKKCVEALDEQLSSNLHPHISTHRALKKRDSLLVEERKNVHSFLYFYLFVPSFLPYTVSPNTS